jgi:hypothetical protein
MRIACVDGQAPDLGHAFAVARALQCLLHARVGADAADRGHHQRRLRVLKRAEGDLDHHLAAVAASRHQIHVGAHRARAWLATIGVAILGMARAHRVGHQPIDRQAHQFVGAIGEQLARRRVGKHDDAVVVHQQQRIGIRREQRAVDRLDVQPAQHAVHPAVTGGTNR